MNRNKNNLKVIPLALSSAVVLTALALLVAMPPAKATGRNSNPGVVPIGSYFDGQAYGEWSGAWWRWAYSIPADINPVADATGQFAAVGQSGPVWFLAGNFGGTTVRTVTVPAGKALFLPIIDS